MAMELAAAAIGEQPGGVKVLWDEKRHRIRELEALLQEVEESGGVDGAAKAGLEKLRAEVEAASTSTSTSTEECKFCGIKNPACIAQCSTEPCSRWFCGLHLVNHQDESKHNEVTLHRQNPVKPGTLLRCEFCEERDVWTLGVIREQPGTNAFAIVCRGVECDMETTGRKLDLTTWKPLKGRRFCTDILQVPSHRELELARPVTPRQICRLEKLWKSNVDAELGEENVELGDDASSSTASTSRANKHRPGFSRKEKEKKRMLTNCNENAAAEDFDVQEAIRQMREQANRREEKKKKQLQSQGRPANKQLHENAGEEAETESHTLCDPRREGPEKRLNAEELPRRCSGVVAIGVALLVIGAGLVLVRRAW